jgi:hypothetical protein
MIWYLLLGLSIQLIQLNLPKLHKIVNLITRLKTDLTDYYIKLFQLISFG